MIFRQLIDRETCTYSYVLADADTREAVIIDAVRDQFDRDCRLLDELDLKLIYAVETHCHADHITGADRLRRRYGAQVAMPKACGASGADLEITHGDVIRFGRHGLEARATPGHTDGCTCFVHLDQSMVFTGDTLFIRGCGRTDFQQGDARTLYNSVHTHIFSLRDDCRVFPAHDYNGATSSTVGEERRYNPRLGGDQTVAEFVAIMDNLQLNMPDKLDVAVPANLCCGQLPDERI